MGQKSWTPPSTSRRASIPLGPLGGPQAQQDGPRLETPRLKEERNAMDTIKVQCDKSLESCQKLLAGGRDQRFFQQTDFWQETKNDALKEPHSQKAALCLHVRHNFGGTPGKKGVESHRRESSPILREKRVLIQRWELDRRSYSCLICLLMSVAVWFNLLLLLTFALKQSRPIFQFRTISTF